MMFILQCTTSTFIVSVCVMFALILLIFAGRLNDNGWGPRIISLTAAVTVGSGLASFAIAMLMAIWNL
jgi:hypothetical protein